MTLADINRSIRKTLFGRCVPEIPEELRKQVHQINNDAQAISARVEQIKRGDPVGRTMVELLERLQQAKQL